MIFQVDSYKIKNPGFHRDFGNLNDFCRSEDYGTGSAVEQFQGGVNKDMSLIFQIEEVTFVIGCHMTVGISGVGTVIVPHIKHGSSI